MTYHATAPLGQTPLKKPLKNPPVPLNQIRYPPIYEPGGYRICYIDPPWEYKVFSAKGTGRSAAQHYNVMTLQQLYDLPIPKIMHKDSVVLLWVTSPGFKEGLSVLDAWGYEFKNVCFTWLKRNESYQALSQEQLEDWKRELKAKGSLPKKATQRLLQAAGDADRYFFGLGHYSRQNPEYCLLGVRKKGKILPRFSHSVRSEVVTPLGRHSAKPLEVRRRIVELFGDIPRIEGFARSRGEGWDAWGYELDGLDVLTSIRQFLPVPVIPKGQLSLFPTPPCLRCGKDMRHGQVVCYLCGSAAGSPEESRAA